jgi:hypothetical protein
MPMKLRMFLIAFITCAGLSLPQYKLTASVISSGAVYSGTPGYRVVGTVGQPLTGNTGNHLNRIISGFWDNRLEITSADEQQLLPAEFRMDQNYPNPFNPSTTIRYGVAEQSHVSIRIFNIVGEELAVLVNEEKEAGWYTVNFNPRRFASGVYIYTMNAKNYYSTKKMIFLK